MKKHILTSLKLSLALLDLIGSPVILLTHSQGGPFGFAVADRRPNLVKAIVTVEPGGPPIKGVDTAKVAYNAAGSGGSNKGPSNPDYLKDVQAHIDSFLVHNPGIKKEDIPVELVTYSGSGLDPDLSPAGARVQVRRVAAARKLSEDKLLALVDHFTERPLLGLFGPAKVNVLKLNVALDQGGL